MGVDLDPLDDLLSDEPVNYGKESSKFQPKPKFRPAKKPMAAASSSKSQAQITLDTMRSGLTETGNIFVPEDNGGGNASMEKSVGMASDIFIGLENLRDFRLEEVNAPPSGSLMVNANHGKPETDIAGESIVSSCEQYSGTNNQEPVRREVEVLRSVHLEEPAFESVQGAGRFQDTSDVRIHEETCEPSKSVSCSPAPFEINDAEKDSSPVFHQDDVLDLSSLGFSDYLAGEDIMESGYVNNGSLNANGGIDHFPQQQLASTSHEDEEYGRSLQRKRQATRLLDEQDDEVLANIDFSGECCSFSAMEEENLVDGNCQVENEEISEKIPSSRKHVVDKGKTARKRKSDEGVPVPRQKPKRFSHSTRRRVNRALLEIPDGEVDYQTIPLRDIILLAEHKEREMKKEAATGESQARQSADTPRNQNESGTLDPHLADENRDGEGNPELQDTTLYFNYQTYMNKPRAIQWSKQDTELFYEAVQQFGTDLSLIQQLFPGLTRKQIKLKYKKEERQHPMRLRQALSSRFKDLSYFQKVIGRLKEMASEENQNADEEIQAEGQMEEGSSSHGHHDEQANDEGQEHIKEGESGDVARETEQDGSQLKDDEEEDDEDCDCQPYTST